MRSKFLLLLLAGVALFSFPSYSQQKTSGGKNILLVNSEPEGATVLIDSVYVGVTPYTDESLPNGRYKIIVRMDGYFDKVYFADLKNNRVEKYAIMSGDYALLNLTSEPSGADFYFNDTIIGQTPIVNFKMPLGRQSISLKLAEYKDINILMPIVSYKYDLNKILEPAYSMIYFHNYEGCSLYIDGNQTVLDSNKMRILYGEHTVEFQGVQLRNSIKKYLLADPPKDYDIIVDKKTFTFKYAAASIIIPGMGQILQDSPIKGVSELLCTGLAGYYCYYAQKTYDDKVNKYNSQKIIYDNSATDDEATANFNKMEELANAANNYKKHCSISIGILAAVYAFNLFDVIYNHTTESQLIIQYHNNTNTTALNFKMGIN